MNDGGASGIGIGVWMELLLLPAAGEGAGCAANFDELASFCMFRMLMRLQAQFAAARALFAEATIVIKVSQSPQVLDLSSVDI